LEPVVLPVLQPVAQPVVEPDQSKQLGCASVVVGCYHHHYRHFIIT